MNKPTPRRIALATAIATLVFGGAALGSSHREAPLITENPKVDGTDLYMFRSYETGRAGYVTFLANYIPFQDPYGGPNFYLMDPDALYAIHIDNDGDARPDISHYFKFHNRNKNLTVPVNGVDVAVAVSNIGPFGDSSEQDANINVFEKYTVVTIHHGGASGAARNLSHGGTVFKKPFDNIGNKSIPNYAEYADRHITRIGLKGCAGEGRVFVGQRKEGFAVNVGEIFDLINTNPLGPRNAEPNDLRDKNVTSIALEVPISCLTDGSPIIGAWTTAYRRSGDHWRQVSRLSAPLVNEVVIGLPDKDKFNASLPVNDAQFAKYVTNPTLPILIQTLYPTVTAPTLYPRTDLVAAFLTGVPGLNQPASVRPAEMMRLNTSIAPTPTGSQRTLGVLAGDTAGFPNGRRPGDDVVDIELRVAMGALLPAADAPSGQLPFTDGAYVRATQFRSTFPYLRTPIPGSPNGAD